ncbi:MAG: EamA family transporter [Chloroflexia bacterium]
MVNTSTIQPLPANSLATRIPPHFYFFASAIFHYLGPAFAVLLFAHVSVLGVAWLRIASAALIFAVWRRPWRIFKSLPTPQRRLILAFGIVLGAMNTCFYIAISLLPLSTVGAIEFIGPVLLAAIGIRTHRNTLALIMAAAGGWILTGVQLSGQPIGLLFAFANCGLFMLYVILGHRIAQSNAPSSIDRLGLAMLIALVTVTPLGLIYAAPALADPQLLLAGIVVGVSSSVIPYVFDQLAMKRLSRATFALLLSLLPASATVIGIFVLAQLPTYLELAGIALIALAVAIHKEKPNGL